MRLLIVSATVHEIQPLLQHFEFQQQKNIFSFQKNHQQIDVLIAGIGSAIFTFHVMEYLQHHRPDAAIQAGFAGVKENFIELGNTFEIVADCFADNGAFENDNYKTLFDLNLMNENEFPFSKAMLANDSKFPIPFHPIKKAIGRSVNLIEADENRLEKLNQKFHCDAESMEGSAFHHVMLHKKIAFKQIRSASNFIGERNKTKWEMKTSIENLSSFLINVVEEFLK
jgi:futalosine hydrolase